MYRRNFSLRTEKDLNEAYLTRITKSNSKNVADSIYYDNTNKYFEINNSTTSGYVRLPLGQLAFGDKIKVRLTYKYISGNNSLVIGLNGSNTSVTTDNNLIQQDFELEKSTEMTSIELNFIVNKDYKFSSFIIGTTGLNSAMKTTHSVFKDVDIEVESAIREDFTRKASIEYNNGNISVATSVMGNSGAYDSFTCTLSDAYNFKIIFNDKVPVRSFPILSITQESYNTQKRLRGMVRSVMDSNGNIDFEFYVEFANEDGTKCKISDLGNTVTFGILATYR